MTRLCVNLHCAVLPVLPILPAVLSFLYNQTQLGLEDIVSGDTNKAVTLANYVHTIHMEVGGLGCLACRLWLMSATALRPAALACDHQ